MRWASEIKLDGGRTISSIGSDPRVYPTPRILSDIESAGRDLLLPMLEEGQDSAGTQVSLDHLGAAAMSATAAVFAKISGLQKRRITFHTVASDGAIARTTQVRAIVVTADLKARIAQLKY